MNVPYIFHPRLVLRIPRLALCTQLKGFDMQQLLTDNVFMEALFLASPVLHAALLKYGEGKITGEKEVTKLRFSVVKYYLRMSSRCTPFGLFSGCAVVEWQPGSSQVIPGATGVQRHTRFDMHYLCALAQHLSEQPFIRDKILFYPNTSYYRMGDEIRYVEYNYIHAKRSYQIASVPASEYIDSILIAAADGIRIDAIVTLLTSKDIDAEEASLFVNEMIAAQLLVHELEPAVTGDEFLHQLIRSLCRIDDGTSTALQQLLVVLHRARTLLEALDEKGSNDAQAYKEIMDCISSLGVGYDESRLLQTDLSFQPEAGNINEQTGKDLLATMEVLNLLNKPGTESNIADFARRYRDRYDDAVMPLLQVLDTETGIGYLPKQGGDVLPLVDDLVLPQEDNAGNTFKWTKREHLLQGKLLAAAMGSAYTIALEPADLKGFVNDWTALPPTLTVMFRQIGEGKIVLESAGGSSAANLLGRFAHGNKEIHQMVNEIVAAEEAYNPDIILAEIVHLPENRTGNVLLHPAFRKYEIPFLAGSSADKAFRINLQDLYVSVQHGKVLLRSKRLGKWVIPRLSTAHNYSFNALPVYHFLCDLQLQNHQPSIGFSWGALERLHRFLPRVTCKGIIISPAQWNFSAKETAPLEDKSPEAFGTALATFRGKWKLPALLVLADSDNELLLNLDDPLMTAVWLDAVKKRTAFVLKEFLSPEPDALVKDSTGRVYNNQLMATLVKQGTGNRFPALPVENDTAGTAVTKRFPLGSEWLYFKVYCGVKSADKILTAGIAPVVEQLQRSGMIDRFFFIRYNDPDFHLRVRFHLTDLAHVNTALQLFSKQMFFFEESGYAWKLHTDAYVRELERYGSGTIALAEDFFYYDSTAVLQLLHHTEDNDREQLRWLWALKAIDDLLQGFKLLLPDKMTLLQQLKEGFMEEFKADKSLKTQLSAKYRLYKDKLEILLGNDGSQPAEEGWTNLLAILADKAASMTGVADTLLQLQAENRLEVPLRDLLGSYIHMLVNRIITSSSRLHELVLYDMLYTYYRSLTERNKPAADK